MAVTRTEQARHISETVTSARTALGWNQAELARQATITPAAISQIEQGERIPTLRVAESIASALSIPLGVLIGQAEASLGDHKARAFYKKFGDIEKLPLADQNSVEEFIVLIKLARAKIDEDKIT